MEIRQIQCDNLGMTKDPAASQLGKTQSGVTNFAFENYNIRIMANTDNTAMAVTNERSTKAEFTVDTENALHGTFLGGCKLNTYLVLFIKDNSSNNQPDNIYRIHYDGNSLKIVLLYRGDLNFDLWHPIEAVGYYESEEVQKIYWVDGYNPNRFINIINVAYEVEGNTYKNQVAKNIVLPDGTLYSLCSEDGTVSYYYTIIDYVTKVWSYGDVYNALYIDHTASSIKGLDTLGFDTYSMIETGVPVYENKTAPFDFQGSISKIASASISKNYSESGYFLAGVIQYFFTYYNKYGIETPIIWNSDLQYISMQDRGAKQDENVSCAFDIQINTDSLDIENFEYLRVYSCYRSSINVTAAARLVTEIALSDVDTSMSVLHITDYGNTGEEVNAADLKYLGGQNIIANTLDYKQDTLFIGDLSIPNTSVIGVQPLAFKDTEINVLEDSDSEEPQKVTIKESNGISWVYKMVSSHRPSGAYSYESELNNSQEEIAGFKGGDVYRFGIQFMTSTGEWTSAQWIGDKYCDKYPVELAQMTMVVLDEQGKNVTVEGFEADGAIAPTVIASQRTVYNRANRSPRLSENLNREPGVITQTMSLVNPNYKQAIPDEDGIYHLKNYRGQLGRHIDAKYDEDGYYIATAAINIEDIYAPVDLAELRRKYVGYRLLMAEMDMHSRRVAEQGVINPTMFNYADRHYNRPFSIPSWIFRPRLSELTNRHYDTLPPQTEDAAELQGIVEKRVPGFDSGNTSQYNAYVMVIGANDGGSYVKWKLVYYNAAHYNNKVKTWVDNNPDKGMSYPSGNTAEELTIRKTTNYAYLSEKLVAIQYAEKIESYEQLFGSEYTVVSSGHVKKVVGKWNVVAGEMLDQIRKDVKGTIDSEGNTLPLVFNSAMLPDGALLKKIAYTGGDASFIGAIIGLAIAIAAAVVASVFTAGAAAAAAGVAAGALASLVAVGNVVAGTVCSALVPVISGVAIAGAAGLAAVASSPEEFKDVDKLMAAKSFVPVNSNHGTSPIAADIRTRTAIRIDELFRTMFATQASDKTWENEDTSRHYQHLMGTRYIKDSQGNIHTTDRIPDPDNPFTHEPSTVKEALGMDYNAYVTGGILTYTTLEEEDLKRKSNLFCADESIVTLNAPDVEDTLASVHNSGAFDLQLIGLIPVHSAYGTYDLQCTAGLNSSSEVLRGRNKEPQSIPTPNVTGLVNGDFYQDANIEESALTSGAEDNIFKKVNIPAQVALYRQWMWNRSASIGLWMPGITLIDPASTEENVSYIKIAPAQLTKKIFANLRYSFTTNYQNPFLLKIEEPKVCLSDQVTLQAFNYDDDIKYYYENVNTISLNMTPYGLVKNGVEYPSGKWPNNETYINTAALTDPVLIKYKETPHILIPLHQEEGVTTILPYTSDEDKLYPVDLYENIEIALPGVYAETEDDQTDLRKWTWKQSKLGTWVSDGQPYLFMGELVKKKFDYSSWMGGYSDYALKQLHWNVAGPITDIATIKTMRSWGDTYYQRWDCEKTYPFSEDEKNGVVDVLSFMLESHLNIDGRSDIHRGLANLLNVRPYNTTFNPIYGQLDNFFSYSVLDEKFQKTIFEADVAWSLTKNNMSDVDSWTSFVATNQMSMEGRFGAVRKILNSGDALIVFQDTGMSVIKYNESTAIPTTSGLPLQLSNTGKVDGYRIVSDTVGCHNKFSINKNSAGVFFTDDYNQAFMHFSQNTGLKDIGQTAGFSQWFKDNITGSIWTPRTRDAFRTSYDEVTHDLYIISNAEYYGCLVYNTLLQKFTSFMSYIDTPMIVRLNSKDGKSGAFAIRNTNPGSAYVEGWQLFEGDAYNRIFGNPVNYSIEYRINPDPAHDSIFTNYQYTADWLAPERKADKEHTFGDQTKWPAGRNPKTTVERRYTTFDTVEAWDEYQYGKKLITTARVGKFPIKAKFRIWRGDIPRDGENLEKKVFMPDRMRNPWIHLKFEKLISETSSEDKHGLSDDSKMIFHNLNVIYYNQYGRF